MATIEREPNEKEVRNQWLLALGFVLLAFTCLYLPSTAQSGVGYALRATALRPFIGLNGMLTTARERASDYDILRAQMDSALSVLSAQRTLALENRQLRALLELRDRSPGLDLRAATVIRPGTPGAESAFLLDVGRRDGVTQFAPVLSDAGLVGVVQEVRETTSVAIDWSHPDFRVASMTPDGEIHGLVEPQRGGNREQDALLLQGTAFLTDLAPGTELHTSARGGVFPRGILIGWVAEVADASSGWSKAYHVIPAVHPGSVTHALVYLGGEGVLDGEGVAPDPSGDTPGP